MGNKIKIFKGNIKDVEKQFNDFFKIIECVIHDINTNTLYDDNIMLIARYKDNEDE